MNNVEIVNNKTSKASQRIISYWVLAIGLTLSYVLFRDSGWQGDKQLHTLMEIAATILALIIGIMSLVHYYTSKNLVFLMIGVGFLGTGFLDGYHTVVTSSYFAKYFPSTLPSLIPWSWVASRLFLSLCLWLSYKAWQNEAQLKKSGLMTDKQVFISGGIMTLVSFLFFAFVPLPRAYYPELVFHRPEEFIPALFFLLALIGYLKKGAWRDDAFEHWLVLSLIVGLVSQAVFMSFSGTLFDFEFDVAHSLKKVSYVLVLTGLFISMFRLFREAEDSRTKLLKLNENLVLERDKAELATRAKDNFLATMSHEIRTPMNGVLGMTQILADTELTHEQKEYLNTIKSSDNVLLDIINDILDYSKIEAGKLDLEPIPFDLHHAVLEVSQLFTPKCREKKIELIVQYESDLEKHFIGDPGRIKQVMINLISNAIKFTEEGHITVGVESIISNEEEAHLSFAVTDTGIGISEEAEKDIFESFTQADASTTREYGGTGLGLAICKQLVELMGGKISVTSEVDTGTTFQFDLLLPYSGTRKEHISSDIDFSNLRILVVDNNQISLNIMSKQLSNWHIRSDTALSGAVAIECLNKGFADSDPFLLVLTDYNMPEMAGSQLIEKVKTNPFNGENKVCIIVLHIRYAW
ncbi:MAG: ATP-binding protein [Proteobacteria bacterium]|nr:ATP-binding protein [Pseudomonadota bacterium]